MSKRTNGTARAGLLTLIIQSGMLQAADLATLHRLLEEARLELDEAEREESDAAEAVERLEDKLAKGKAEHQAAADRLQDANYYVDCITRELDEGRPAAMA